MDGLVHGWMGRLVDRLIGGWMDGLVVHGWIGG